MEFHRDRCEGTFGGGNKRAYYLRQGALHIYFKAILQTVCVAITTNIGFGAL